jgi:hypothetical protein
MAATDEAAIDEAFGSFPAQLKMTDRTPVLLTPAVVSFSPFLQTSKQSIRIFPYSNSSIHSWANFGSPGVFE